MDCIDQPPQQVRIGGGKYAMPQVEDVAGASGSALQDILHFVFNNGPGG